MITNELLSFIRTSKAQGHTDADIKERLHAGGGWTEADLDEAFKKAIGDMSQAQTEARNQPTIVMTPSSGGSKKAIFSIVLILLLLLGAGYYFKDDIAVTFLGGDNPQVEVSAEPSVNRVDEMITEELSENSSDQEIIFADKLASCIPYKMTFKHPFSETQLFEREILGITNDLCGYVEAMPSNGAMMCNYSAEQRVAIAKYYKDTFLAESFGVDVVANETGQKTTYFINGKEVENPLQEALQSGICFISSY